MDIRKPATGNTTTMERIGNSTYYSAQHWRNNLASGGIVGGGVISDAGGGTINVTAGQCAIRPSASHTSTLYFADFPAATGLVIPTDTIRYVGVEYNAGSPIIALRTADDFDYMTNFPVGVVTNEAGVLHLATADLHDVSDSASHVAERFEHTVPFARDEVIGGIVIGETGTRNITMSAGAMWQKLRKLTVSAFNSSTGGTFDIYYRAVSGFTKVAAQTQWPNTQYDNGTGTLATLGANKYAVLWFYVEPDDSMVIMLYGRGEYNGIAAAEAESPPATVPNRITAGGKIVAKLIFQKSAATATSIYSVFTTVFSTTGASNHANLSNLDYASAGHTGFQSVLTNSAGLAAALSDETGTGFVVFSDSPVLITPKSTTTIGVGNATPAASGAGITFPATQSASTDPNTLDDYEEGTWTPTITFGGAAVGVTYNTTGGDATSGRYTKVGNKVSFTGWLNLTSKGSSTGPAVIAGLPFTNSAGSLSFAPCVFVFVRISYANMLCGHVQTSTNTIALVEVTEAGTQTDIWNTDFQDNTWVNVSGTYFTS